MFPALSKENQEQFEKRLWTNKGINDTIQHKHGTNRRPGISSVARICNTHGIISWWVLICINIPSPREIILKNFKHNICNCAQFV